MSEASGCLSWITESVVHAESDGSLNMAELVWIGEDRLAAEVIALEPGAATLQVYEDTSGLRVGDELFGSGSPLSVRLGPGLVGSTYDGIQRRLHLLQERSGIFIARGEKVDPLDPERQWEFEPRAKEGEEASPGDLLGTVRETELLEHRILVPPAVRGKIESIVGQGSYSVEEEIAVIRDPKGEAHSLTMVQSWPVRRARPLSRRLDPSIPLITGQRIIDSFFPVAKGGTAAVPGPFGSGKTVLQHSLAKWSDADLIVYVGCGERGNEMAQVLEDFPELEDPRSGRPLMERTVLIANTSNMPVAARESSIYTGITVAEYFRDQGYDVALMADSTSRWAEALREISGRLEEMPAEEGFPAYLPTRLARFYERAGRVRTLGGEEGSVTVIGAVSPPGGDFSEPVSRHTQRFTQCWWALDRELANERHYPSVSWLDSYSLYLEQISGWWEENQGANWLDLRRRAMEVLQQESNLQQMVELVGPDALAVDQRWLLQAARLLREGFLQQNAFHEIDAFAVAEKQLALLQLFLQVYSEGRKVLDRGVSLAKVMDEARLADLIRLKEEVSNDEPERIEKKGREVMDRLESLGDRNSGPEKSGVQRE